jgi:predicted Zn-ribbon and HTH transcriptional regulator
MKRLFKCKFCGLVFYNVILKKKTARCPKCNSIADVMYD